LVVIAWATSASIPKTVRKRERQPQPRNLILEERHALEPRELRFVAGWAAWVRRRSPPLAHRSDTTAAPLSHPEERHGERRTRMIAGTARKPERHRGEDP
jgi:hypothetical protein